MPKICLMWFLRETYSSFMSKERMLRFLDQTGLLGAILDGQVPEYWDGMGDHGILKPKFFKVNTTAGSTFKNIHLLNCPRQCWSIDHHASNTTLIGCDVDVSAGESLGKNTDGYDISASDITIEDATVHNQDDCIAINRGSNIKISGMTCIGGHGLSLSVGTVREPYTVKNVTFSDCKIYQSYQGIHVKTHADALSGGSISNVVYSNIFMSGITKNGINVQQDYADGKSTGIPANNIPIEGLTLDNVRGTVNGTESMAVYILCGADGYSSFEWNDVSITGGVKSSKCNYNPNGFGCS